MKKNIDPTLEGKRPIDLILDEFGRDYSMRRIMEDDKLLELVKDIKKLFDLGYEQFIKLSKYHFGLDFYILCINNSIIKITHTISIS